MLDTARTLLQAEQDHAQSTTNISINLVQLYKALGGGWELTYPSRAVRAAGRCPTNPAGKELNMTVSMLALTPLAALIAGLLILVIPRLLNYIVAIYLIIIGLLGLFPHLAG